jgi:hypothetical protein
VRHQAIISLLLAVAFGFSAGWIFRMQGGVQNNLTLKVLGKQQGEFMDLKSRPSIDELAWISPSVAVSSCGVQKFKVESASDNVEWAEVPLQSTTNAQLNCIFGLGTRPSKYDLSFEILASEN